MTKTCWLNLSGGGFVDINWKSPFLFAHSQISIHGRCLVAVTPSNNKRALHPHQHVFSLAHSVITLASRNPFKVHQERGGQMRIFKLAVGWFTFGQYFLFAPSTLHTHTLRLWCFHLTAHLLSTEFRRFGEKPKAAAVDSGTRGGCYWSSAALFIICCGATAARLARNARAKIVGTFVWPRLLVRVVLGNLIAPNMPEMRTTVD